MKVFVITLKNGKQFEILSEKEPEAGNDGLFEFKMKNVYSLVPKEMVISIEEIAEKQKPATHRPQ